MKKAHIINRPNHEVGDRVMTLCGKKHKVAVLWDDVPDDKPICRACVNAALVALTEADKVIELARRRVDHLSAMIRVHDRHLNEYLQLDAISAVDQAYQQELDDKAFSKAEKNQAKQTCTCTWTSSELRVVNPECPVHKDEGDATVITTTEETNQ